MCKGPVAGVRGRVKESAGGREQAGRVQEDPRSPAGARVLTGTDQKPVPSACCAKGVPVSHSGVRAADIGTAWKKVKGGPTQLQWGSVWSRSSPQRAPRQVLGPMVRSRVILREAQHGRAGREPAGRVSSRQETVSPPSPVPGCRCCPTQPTSLEGRSKRSPAPRLQVTLQRKDSGLCLLAHAGRSRRLRRSRQAWLGRFLVTHEPYG